MIFLLPLLAIIIAASVYDCWLTLKTNLQPVDEKNPMARWLLKRWGADGLVVAKSMGTVIAVSVIAGLFDYDPTMGLTVGGAVAAFMGWLVLYLWWYS